MFPTYPDLAGRTALVTGASSGIGRGVAEALLKQGMRVAGQHRTHPPPQGTIPIRADLSSERGCGEAVRAARERLGEVHLLVHSAGIYGAAPIASISAAALEEMCDASSHCIGQDLCISGGALLVVPRGQMRSV